MVEKAKGVAVDIIKAPEAPVDESIYLTLSATEQVNPNNSGRASPLHVYGFLLSSDAQFNTASLEALMQTSPPIEGILHRETLVLSPGESRSLHWKWLPDTQHVAWVGAYQSPYQSIWRASKKLEGDMPHRVDIVFDRNTLEIEP